MNKLILLIIIHASAVCFAQSDPFPANIHTSRTSLHRNIPGTRIYIIPPAGFRMVDYKPELRNDSNYFIVANDWIGKSYYKSAKTFSKARFEKDGVKLVNYQVFKINGYSAIMATYNDPDDAGSIVYNLVFGNAEFSTSVLASIPSGDKVVSVQMIRSLKSLFYDPAKQVSPFALVPFQIDATGSLFKMTSHELLNYHFRDEWVYFYDVKETRKDTGSFAPYIKIVCRPSVTDGETSMVSTEILDGLKKKGLTAFSNKKETEENANGSPVYYSEGYGNFKGKKMLVFLYIASIDGQSVILQGICYADYEKWLAEFKKLAAKIRKK